jgi:hypothetical protein
MRAAFTRQWCETSGVAILPAPSLSADANALAREAAAVLADALAQLQQSPGERDRFRLQLESVIDLAKRALVGAQDAKTIARSRTTLVKALAARGQDARHGAGQLSLGAQRAPTREDCEDGWQRVAEIVAVAENSAHEARRLATELDSRAGWKAARAAEAAAAEARRLIDERNHAYTFHADPSFSFGEGWYLAAAAVLDDVLIQIEPDKPQSAQVERFVHDTGLLGRTVPYRSRPRANKHLPEIIARAFRADPLASQRKLRAAFLGDAPVAPQIVDWIDARLAKHPAESTVLLWVRYGKHHPTRNTSHDELVELTRRARVAGLLPVLLGDALRGDEIPDAVDMTLFWKDPIFQEITMRRAQLQFFEHLRGAHGLRGQLGVTTAGMDGPALLGLPTMYLTDAPNPRLGTWVGTVPGYQEMVRGPGYLERISEGLRRWASPGQQ